MKEMFRKWRAAAMEKAEPIQEDLYLVHRVLADFPQAYAALREAFRIRDAAAAGPAVLCSRCRCEVPVQGKNEGGG